MNDLQLMSSGLWHNGKTQMIGEALMHTRRLCHRLNMLDPDNEAERCRILIGMLGKIEPPFVIHSPFRCDFGSQIHIGRNFMANYNLTVLDEAGVTIGNEVLIGPNVSIFTIIHALDPIQRAEGIMRSAPVSIGNNVWIGGNVVILPGVTIGDGAVIGAGSVVTRPIPPGVLAAGNPCQIIRNITESDKVSEIASPS